MSSTIIFPWICVKLSIPVKNIGIIEFYGRILAMVGQL